MTSCPEAMGWGSWVFFKKSSQLRFEPRRVQLGLGGEPCDVRSDGTVSILKIVCLSPRVENVKVKKVIKLSYLNQRRVVSVSCFSDPNAHGHFMHLNILAVYYN